MAQARIKPGSILFNGKLLGQAHQNKMSKKSGDEPQFGDGGFVGMSDGAATTTITATTIVPVTGLDVDLDSILDNKLDVDIIIGAIGKNLQRVTCRCTGADYTSDHKNGTLEGNFEFMGGQATRI